MRYILFMMLGMAFISCDTTSNAPAAADPYSVWQAQGLHDYSFEQTRTCFCPDAGKAVKIIVRADTIASVSLVSDGAEVPREMYVAYKTVGQMFTLIHSGTDSVIVRYHASLGYPEYLDVDPQFHAVDGGALYETAKLLPLTP